VRVHQSVQLHQRPNALAPGEFRLRRAPREHDPGELAISEQGVQFGDEGVDKEQNQDPELDRDEAAPRKVLIM
jgi:hypothetical protein